MDKARRILVGGWMDTAISVFTRGLFLLGGSGVTYEVSMVYSPQSAAAVISPQQSAAVISSQQSAGVKSL